MGATEEKLRKLGQELDCQRHNAEAARQLYEQRMKDRERELQVELGEQSNMLREMEKILQQEQNKLQQETNKVCSALQSQ